MNRLISLALVVAIATILAPGTAAQNGAEKTGTLTIPKPRAFTMGFVDMERLIKEHKTTKAKTEQFQKEFRDQMEKLKLQVDEMNNIRDTLDVHAEGSREHLEQLKRIKKLEATLELEQRIIKIEFQLKIVKTLKDIYQRCREVVGVVAKERQFSAVAMVSTSEVDGRTRSEIVGDILTRPFVFFDPALDITNEVIARMK